MDKRRSLQPCRHVPNRFVPLHNSNFQRNGDGITLEDLKRARGNLVTWQSQQGETSSRLAAAESLSKALAEVAEVAEGQQQEGTLHQTSWEWYQRTCRASKCLG